MSKSAVVTIGLPVYNNEQFISPMLESVLQQDFTEFVLIISDDCSTDNTEKICREYAARDQRVQYIRNDSNIGPLENHRKVLEMAKTDYFMFARGHEILPSDLLSQAMTVLENQDQVVLACAPTRWIDEQGVIREDNYLKQFDTRGCNVMTRCLLILWGKCESFYGVGLTRNFNSIRVLEPTVGTDLIMLMEMGLLGSFAILPCGDRLRRHFYTENYSGRLNRHAQALIKNPDFIDRHFPVVKLPFKILRSIWQGKIRGWEKVLTTILILLAAPVKYLVSIGRTQ